MGLFNGVAIILSLVFLTQSQAADPTPRSGVDKTHAEPLSLPKGSRQFNINPDLDHRPDVDVVIEKVKRKDGQSTTIKIGCTGYMVDENTKERVFTLEADGVVYNIERETLKRELLNRGFKEEELDSFFEYLCQSRDGIVSLDGSKKYNDKFFSSMSTIAAAALEILEERKKNHATAAADRKRVREIYRKNQEHTANSSGDPPSPPPSQHPH